MWPVWSLFVNYFTTITAQSTNVYHSLLTGLPVFSLVLVPTVHSPHSSHCDPLIYKPHHALHVLYSPVVSHSTIKSKSFTMVCEAVLISRPFIPSLTHWSTITLTFLLFASQQASSHLRSLHSSSCEPANHTPSAHGWFIYITEASTQVFLIGGFPTHLISNGQSRENEFAQTNLLKHFFNVPNDRVLQFYTTILYL